MLNHKIGLGTVQFGVPYGISNSTGQTKPEEVSKILQYAIANGILVIDTASAYGNAEQVLGENDLSKFNIVSKYITPSAGKSIEEQLQHTLTHLQVKKLYGYLAHRPVEILEDASQWKTIKDFQQKELVEKIGFSLNTPEELQALLDKNFIPDLIQVPYNYFDNRFENLMNRLKDKGCEIHTRSVFLQGLFFKDSNTLPDFFSTIKPLIKNVQQQTKNVSGALLRFAASKAFIDTVIIGVENKQQFQTNINDLNIEFELDKNNTKISEKILMPMYWPKA
jgi:aryl-alcohol dehydrogenase-like predicted oxidoreductase